MEFYISLEWCLWLVGYDLPVGYLIYIKNELKNFYYIKINCKLFYLLEPPQSVMGRLEWGTDTGKGNSGP